MSSNNVLSVRDLAVAYESKAGSLRAIDGIDLDIGQNEFLAVVGESGCGKSTLGLTIIGLLPEKSRIVSGSITYKNVDLVKLPPKKALQYRGTEIGMIFQEPLTSLNPVYKVGLQIAEAISIRNLRRSQLNNPVIGSDSESEAKKVTKIPRFRQKIPNELKSEIIDWLNLVRIPDPEQILDRYAFELSGGMRQRVVIAMALSQEPSLLVADEPTTALDVTTQAQVLKLMKELMDKVKTSIVLVTHDFAVASQVADRVVVMYAGKIVEDAEIHNIFSSPLHPYTKGLFSCIPSGSKRESSLKAIPGSIPNLMYPPRGCRFAPRCQYVMDVCQVNAPPFIQKQQNQKVACFLYE